MAQGLMTEREWRKQLSRGRQYISCWGACWQPQQKKRMIHDRRLWAAMLALSVMISAAFPLLLPRAVKTTFQQKDDAQTPQKRNVQPRSVSAVSYAIPENLELETRSYTLEELLRGKLLWIDEEHPLPKGVPTPHTMTIAAYGKGMVPVSNLAARSGAETIAALQGLFSALQKEGVGCFTVCQGTMGAQQQRQAMIESLSYYAAQMPFPAAVQRTVAENDAPGSGELQQQYTVDINRSTKPVVQPEPLEMSVEGRALLQNSWRHGFITKSRWGGWRLRYVGQAHSTAMAFLNVDLPEYIMLLHEKGQIVVQRDANTTYLILCSPIVGGYAHFRLPKGIRAEVSADNAGYAIASCILDGKKQAASE